MTKEVYNRSGTAGIEILKTKAPLVPRGYNRSIQVMLLFNI